MKTFVLALMMGILGMFGVSVAETDARQAVCPADSDNARRMIAKFLDSPANSSLRQEWGVAGVSVTDVRVLTDSADAAVCEQLNSIVGANPGGDRHYYTASGFYFVALYEEAALGTIPLRTRPLLVLDAQLNPKGVAGT